MPYNYRCSFFLINWKLTHTFQRPDAIVVVTNVVPPSFLFQVRVDTKEGVKSCKLCLLKTSIIILVFKNNVSFQRLNEFIDSKARCMPHSSFVYLLLNSCTDFSYSCHHQTSLYWLIAPRKQLRSYKSDLTRLNWKKSHKTNPEYKDGIKVDSWADAD